ncbi:hypothetical protein SNE40_009261 [Patella caerulea]|uniref:Galectin domain-containing protein n=1 Tax=Patella caerulea TaxID=87958 RepID=A0AAN8PQE4_PATCE
MSYQVNRISAPQIIAIPGGLKVGTQIVIRGKTPYSSEGFSLNFQNDHDGSNIALHFNPRTDGNTVVRNSYAGDWHDEETDSPHFPFLEGKKFTLRFLVTPDEYDISVNGKDFVKFSHRLPFNEVEYLKLNDNAEYYDLAIQNNKTAPFNAVFPDRRLREGVAVRIRGVILPDAQSFAVNFNCDSDGENTGFHFNPRQFSNIVLRNSKFGDWGEEETDSPDFPFHPGQYFDLLIIATQGRFNVYVNGKFFTLFNYRCPVEDMKYIYCGGDLSIADVDIYEPLRDDFSKEIKSGLEKSDMIVVKGFFYPEGESFSINLLNGYSIADSDIAFHLNPRRNEGEVIMNSRFGGDWGGEERVPNPPAFLELLPFEVKIIVKSSKFKVYVNGKKFESYKARGNVDDIKSINATGDAYIFEAKLLQRLDQPVIQKIPGNLQPGRWLFFLGTAKKDAQNFVINLQCNDSMDYDGSTDIALHFNPRFSDRYTVRNHLIDGNWGDEENDQAEFPFEEKDTFEIAMQVLNDEYKVYVDGKHYIDYKHRMDMNRVCHIMLAGDANFFEPDFN